MSLRDGWLGDGSGSCCRLIEPFLEVKNANSIKASFS